MAKLRISRRGFILGMVSSAGLLSLGVSPRARADEASPAFEPNVWMKLEADGTVLLTCNRSEMGQGIRSSIPALLAMELGADLGRIQVVQATGNPVYGNQNTDGSRSIRNQYDMLRRMAAVGRTVLERAGAKHLGVPEGSVVCREHAVIHEASGQRVAFGELSAAASALPLPDPDSVELRADHPASGWDLPVVDTHAWVTGQAQYGADIRLDGMLTAVIVRPPVLGSALVEVDDQAARAMPGVVDVVIMPTPSPPMVYQPLGGVAVIAQDTWTAIQASKALKIQWSESPHDSASWEADREHMRGLVAQPGNPRRVQGDVEAALKQASATHTATYVVPHLAHAALEPPAAVARVTASSCEVWACVQTPQRARTLAAEALGLAEDAVTVNVTFLGAAFGRKSKPDFVVEAVLLAKSVGRPVRVQWLRDEALSQGYLHASSVQNLTAGLGPEGQLVAWRQRIASPTIGSTFDAELHELRDSELSQGLSDLPLAVEHISMETHPVQERVRIGWLRSVYNINHAFSVQSFLDELAHRQGTPLPDYIKEVLGPVRSLTEEESGMSISNYGAPLDEHPIEIARYHRVMDRVRAMSNYDSPPPEGRARGFAVHRSFLTYVAVVVEVSRRDEGGPRLERVWVAADPGRIVHRDRVRAQLEGAVIFGASIALYGRLDIRDGRITSTSFRDYRLLRMHEAPRSIEIEVITEGERPGGVGEPGLPPVAPAIANAWFALTGERVRELPIMPPLPDSASV